MMEINSHQNFTYDKLVVFFKHTDYQGFVHPYNYLEWMSYTREAFFQELVPNFLELCDRDIKMVTASVEFESAGDAIFGDRITVKIYSERVKRLSFDVVFIFSCEERKTTLGTGRMRLTFLDAATGRPTQIPTELKEAVLRFERRVKSSEEDTVQNNESN